MSKHHLTWKHKRDRQRAKALMKDGAPCWWCGRPMHHNQRLEADHEISVKGGGHTANRMLHHKCNRQRGDGLNGKDQRRPALQHTDSFPMLDIIMQDGSVDTRYPSLKPQENGPADYHPPFIW